MEFQWQKCSFAIVYKGKFFHAYKIQYSRRSFVEQNFFAHSFPTIPAPISVSHLQSVAKRIITYQMRRRWCCVLINFYLYFSLFIFFLLRLFHFPADSISREALRCLLKKSWVYIKMNDQTEMNSLTQNTKKDTSVLWLNKGHVTNCTKNTNIYWHYNNLAKHDYHFSIEHLTYEFLSHLQKNAQNLNMIKFRN